MLDAAPATLLDEHARPNRFEVDLGAIAQFTRNIRGLVGGDATVFAALKCNAYGFGLLPVARTVLASGADAIAVVDRADAITLRQTGVNAPILVYPGGIASPAAVAACAAHDLIPTLVDLESAAVYSRLAPRRLDVAVKIDIGQERLGFAVDDAVEAITTIAALPNLRVRIVNSHPNVPEPPSQDYLAWQLGRFETICTTLAGRGIDVPIRMIASPKRLSVLGRWAFNAVDPGQLCFGAFRAARDVPC